MARELTLSGSVFLSSVSPTMVTVRKLQTTDMEGGRAGTEAQANPNLTSDGNLNSGRLLQCLGIRKVFYFPFPHPHITDNGSNDHQNFQNYASSVVLRILLTLRLHENNAITTILLLMMSEK